MEQILNKLKTSSIVTFIFAFIAISWIVVDYFVIKEIFRNAQIDLGLELVLIIISGMIFIVFIISVFVTSYRTLRFFMKYRSEEKKNKIIEKTDLI